MSGRWRWLGTSAIAGVALVLALSGLASATGSGYNQSYTQTPTNVVAAVGLTAVSSSYSAGPTMTVSFSVAGTINLTSDYYGYWIYFGGTSSDNASAIVEFSNNTTAGFWYAYTTSSFTYGYQAFVLSNGGATMTFQINITAVGPSTDFAIDAYAWYETDSSVSYSWLGTDYQNIPGGGGGGGTCTDTSCTTNAANTLFGGFILLAIIGVVVVIVIIVVVVVLVTRKRPPAAQMPPPGAPGWAPPPPPPPGMAPPPPPPPQ